MKLIIALVLILTLAGCQALPFPTPFQRKETMQLPEVSIGTQGVELSLAPNNPPREVYEGSQFAMLVTLSNLGTMDVEQGVYTVGYDPQHLYLTRQQAQGRFAVRGKSIFNPGGEERQINLLFTTKPLGPQLSLYPATLTFNACYPYQTTAPLVTCIDTDIFGKQTTKACVPQFQAFPQGQGAPVVVSSVEPRMLPHEDPNRIRPEFVLTLQNQGTGDVVAAQRYMEACSGRPLGEDGWNMLSVDAALSDQMLTCTPTPVALRQTETRVVCTLPEGIDVRQGTYTTPLTVTLTYGYLTSITTQVDILKTAA
jgi:hypothetical protein